MLTGCNDSETHRMCLRMSAVGVFTKDQPNALLLKAIRQVHSGELWINRHTTTALFHDFRRQTELVPPSARGPAGNGLTRRERDIAVLAARGLPAKKIAAQLQISDKTVRNHLVVVYDKLNVNGQLELALQAGPLGLLPDE